MGGASSRYQLGGSSTRSTASPGHPGLHPRCGILGVVDLGPAIAAAQVVRRVVVFHDAAVVEEVALQQQVDGVGAELPPRRDVADRAHAAEVGDQLDALVEHVRLLLAGHGERILVRVAVHAQLVAVLHDQLRFLRKALDGVAGDVPRGLDAVAVHHLQDARHPLSGREDAARDVAGRIGAAERSDPERDRIEMGIETNLNVFLRGHGFPPYGVAASRRLSDADTDAFASAICALPERVIHPRAPEARHPSARSRSATMAPSSTSP